MYYGELTACGDAHKTELFAQYFLSVFPIVRLEFVMHRYQHAWQEHFLVWLFGGKDPDHSEEPRRL